MTIVFMFPGQSSRSSGMLERIIAAWPQAAGIVDRASGVLGRDLRAIYARSAGEAFSTNRDVQVGVFLALYLHQQALEAQGIAAGVSLGLSLGEYNHLVHAGAVDFDDALRLVDTRGSLYDAGPDGMMVSIFPLPIEELEPFVERARGVGVVEIANRNSPSQNVIAGERRAVEAAMAEIEAEEPAVQPVVIEHRIPMHTSLFRGVGTSLRPHLDRTPWRVPLRPYVPNVSAAFVTAPEAPHIADSLERHASSPVLWRDSIDLIAATHPDACFVEVGPGAVLFNLLQRQWRSNKKLRSDDRDDPIAQLNKVVSELQRAA